MALCVLSEALSICLPPVPPVFGVTHDSPLVQSEYGFWCMTRTLRRGVGVGGGVGGEGQWLEEVGLLQAQSNGTVGVEQVPWS
jgi:hypothetical protein